MYSRAAGWLKSIRFPTQAGSNFRLHALVTEAGETPARLANSDLDMSSCIAKEIFSGFEMAKKAMERRVKRSELGL